MRAGAANGDVVKRVVIVGIAPVQELDVVGPMSVFSTANACLDAAGSECARYAPELVSGGDSLVLGGQCGADLVARRSFAAVRGPIDTLIVAGGSGARGGGTPALMAWLRRRAATARRVGSVCTGAFVLAQAGLLEGRRATTHWAHAAELGRRYERVAVDAEPIWTQDGNVFTSAGVSAGMDLSLAFVERDCGGEIALAVARSLVLYLRRPGGQSQFSVALEAQGTERREIRELVLWIGRHLREDLRVAILAERAGMSERNFVRVFAREAGVSPARFVERARLEAARRRLETTDADLDLVAAACGFGGREVFRRAFVRHAGVTPSAYRERFRSAP